jgi:hypothetical protein
VKSSNDDRSTRFLFHSQNSFFHLEAGEKIITRSLLRDNKLWIYTVLPALILNIASLGIYGGYYGLKYTQPGVVAAIPENTTSLVTYAIIFLVEWLFALGIISWLRRNGLPLRVLVKPAGRQAPFR